MSDTSQARPNEVGVPRMVPASDTIAVLCLDGDFDMANAPRIIEEGERVLLGDRDLVVDLSCTTFLDSFAIEALFEVGAEASRCGRIAVMQLGTVTTVERLLELSRLDSVLPRTTTRPDAIETVHRLRDRSSRGR